MSPILWRKFLRGELIAFAIPSRMQKPYVDFSWTNYENTVCTDPQPPWFLEDFKSPSSRELGGRWNQGEMGRILNLYATFIGCFWIFWEAGPAEWGSDVLQNARMRITYFLDHITTKNTKSNFIFTKRWYNRFCRGNKLRKQVFSALCTQNITKCNWSLHK